MNPVHWFEIPVTDMDRAVEFYKAVFAIEFTTIPAPDPDMHMMGFPMEWGLPGASGALLQYKKTNPGGNGVTIYFTTPDIESLLKRAETAGGTISMSKTDIGEYGWMGSFMDPDGNVIGVHTSKEK